MDYKIFDSFTDKQTYFIVFNNANPINFNIKDLTGAGRLDVCCRVINSSFLLSNGIRKNVILIAYFKTIDQALIIDGSKAKGINPDERSTAGFLRSVFEGKRFPGSIAIQIKFEQLIFQLSKRNYNLVVLHEDGENIKDNNLFSLSSNSVVFVLGDNKGLTKEELELLENYPRISLGKKSYLTSTVITLLNYYHDQLDLDKD